MTDSIWDDSRITSYVLGELPEEERAAFESEMTDNASLRAAVDEARNVTDRIGGFFEGEAALELEKSRRTLILEGAAIQEGAAVLERAANAEDQLTASNEEAQVSVADKNLSAPSWGVPAIATAIAASLVLLIGVAPWLRQQAVVTAVAPESESPNTPAPAAVAENASEDIEEASASNDVMLSQANAASADKSLEANRGTSGLGSSQKVTEANSDPSFSVGSESMLAEVQVGEDVKSEKLQGVPENAANAMAKQSVGLSKADDPAMLPSAKSLGLPNVDALAMDNDSSKRRTVQSIENANPSQRLSRAMKRGRSLEAQASGLNLAPAAASAPAPAMNKGKQDLEVVQAESTQLARGSADALFRQQVDPVAEADQGFDDEIRALNEKLFGSSGAYGGGMGGGGAKAGSAQTFPVVDNPFQDAADVPASSFSIQTPAISYRSLRDTLMRSATAPVPGAVRIEEMLNYFPYKYATPKRNANHPFAASLALSDCPWKAGNLLARVAVQGESFDWAKRRPCNLVFMIDTSGSMDAPNKTPVFAQAFRSLAQQLKNQDRVAVIAFADASGVVLKSTSARSKKQITQAMSKLSRGGSTEHGKGFSLAVHIAKENLIDDGVNRIVVCTDGDLSNARLVKDSVSDATNSGVRVSVVGFDQSKLAAAKRRLGPVSSAVDYLLVDSRADAKKQLATQLMPQPRTIANDVKLKVQFNPDNVDQYRLIGWENHLAAKNEADTKPSQNDQFSQGQSVTALYEIVPTDTASIKSQWLTVNLDYTRPGAAKAQATEFKLEQEPSDFEACDADFRFAAAVAGLGMTLRGSQHRGDWTVKEIQSVAKQSLGTDQYGVRAEFLQLSQTAGQYVPKAAK